MTYKKFDSQERKLKVIAKESMEVGKAEFKKEKNARKLSERRENRKSKKEARRKEVKAKTNFREELEGGGDILLVDRTKLKHTTTTTDKSNSTTEKMKNEKEKKEEKGKEYKGNGVQGGDHELEEGTMKVVVGLRK